MNRALRDVGVQFRTKAIEFLLLVILAIAATVLAAAFPAHKDYGTSSNSWQGKHGETWWWAHQLYGRSPEHLSQSQRRDVDRWCRCAHLLSSYSSSGLQTLTDDECREIAETLSDVWPNLEEHDGYFTIYKACLQRLGQSNQLAETDAAAADYNPSNVSNSCWQR